MKVRLRGLQGNRRRTCDSKCDQGRVIGRFWICTNGKTRDRQRAPIGHALGFSHPELSGHNATRKACTSLYVLRLVRRYLEVAAGFGGCSARFFRFSSISFLENGSAILFEALASI